MPGHLSVFETAQQVPLAVRNGAVKAWTGEQLRCLHHCQRVTAHNPVVKSPPQPP